MKFRVFCMSMTMFVLAINSLTSKLPAMVYAGGSFGKAKADCMYKGGECLGVGCQRCVFNESAAAAVIKPKLPVKEAPKLPVKEAPKLPVKEAPKPPVKKAPKLSIKSPSVDFRLIVDSSEDKRIVCQLLSEQCSSCNNMVVTMEYPPRKTTRTEICRLISPECRSCENIVVAL